MYSMNFLAITTVVLALIILYRVIRVSVYDFKKTPVRLVAKRKKSNNIHSSVASVQKYINGGYLIALRGDSEIDKYSLMQARSVFEKYKKTTFYPNLTL